MSVDIRGYLLQEGYNNSQFLANRLLCLGNGARNTVTVDDQCEIVCGLYISAISDDLNVI